MSESNPDEDLEETNQALILKYGEGEILERECPKCGSTSNQVRTAGVHRGGDGGIAVYCDDEKFQCWECGFREEDEFTGTDQISSEDTGKRKSKDKAVLCVLCGKYTVKIPRHLQRKPHNLSSTIARNWKLIFDPESHAKKLKICPINSCQQAVVRMDHHLRDKHADVLELPQYHRLCKQFIRPEDWLRRVAPFIDAARTVTNVTSSNQNPTSTTTLTFEETPESVIPTGMSDAGADAGFVDEFPKMTSGLETSDEDEIHQLGLEIERDVEWDKKTRKNPHLSLFLSYLTFDLCKHRALAENYLSIVTNAWQVTDSTFSDVATLTNRSTLRQFYREMHEKGSKPGTIKSYLLAIRIFIRFLVVRSVVRETKQVQEALLAIEMLSLWFQALRKMVGMRVAELQVLEEQRLLTLNQIQGFLNSKFATDMVSELFRNSDVITSQQFCGCRDFMAAVIQVRTGVRGGPLASMVLDNIKNATYGHDEMHTITIPKHKTAYVYGAQHVCLNSETFKWLLKFLEMREKYLAQPSNIHVFTSMTGRPVSSSNISAYINTAWQKSKVLTESQPRLNATSVRKALVTIQREMMPGQEENLATAMAHSMRVQEAHYNVRKTRKQVLEVSKQYSLLLDERVSQCQPTASEMEQQESKATESHRSSSVLSMRRVYTSDEEDHISQEFADEIAGYAKLNAKNAKKRLRKWKSLRDLTDDQIVNKVKSLRKQRLKKIKYQKCPMPSKALCKPGTLQMFNTENTMETWSSGTTTETTNAVTAAESKINQESLAGIANTEDIPEVTNAAVIPEPVNAEAVPETTNGEIITEATNAVAVPETTNADVVPEATNGEVVSETTNGEIIPEAMNAEAVPETTNADVAPEATNGEVVPEKTNREVVPYQRKVAQNSHKRKSTQISYRTKRNKRDSRTVPGSANEDVIPEIANSEVVLETENVDVLPEVIKPEVIPELTNSVIPVSINTKVVSETACTVDKHVLETANADVIPETDIYRIECIIRKRKRNRRKECLVKWEGYGKEHNSWVLENNVVDIATDIESTQNSERTRRNKRKKRAVRESANEVVISETANSGVVPETTKVSVLPEVTNPKVMPEVTNVEDMPVSTITNVVSEEANSEDTLETTNAEVIPETASILVVPEKMNTEIIPKATNVYAIPKPVNVAKSAQSSSNFSPPVAPSASQNTSLVSPSLNDEMLTKYFPEFVGGRRSIIVADVQAKCQRIDDPIFHELLDSFLGLSSYKKLCVNLKNIRKRRQLESYEEIRKSKRLGTTKNQ